MIQSWFGVHDGLLTAARIPPIARLRERITAAEVVLLLLCGASAALATGFLRLGLRIPGNAIVLAVIPMALGLALAPRRLGGFLMSAGALGTAALVSGAGLAHYGSGAFVSLCLAGPVMDFAVARGRKGWRLYAALVASGVVTNLLALGSRAASKLLGLDIAATMRPFDSWWFQASITYTLCGAVAGLIGAICCFNLRNRESQPTPGTEL